LPFKKANFSPQNYAIRGRTREANLSQKVTTSEKDREVFFKELFHRFSFQLDESGELIKVKGKRKYKAPLTLLQALYQNSQTASDTKLCFKSRDNLKDILEGQQTAVYNFFEEIKDEFFQRVKETETLKSKRVEQILKNGDKLGEVQKIEDSIDPTNYAIVINKMDGEPVLLNSDTLQLVDDMSYEFFKKAVGSKESRELEENARPCIMEYRPFSNSPGWVESNDRNEKHWVVNTYHPPLWRKVPFNKTPEMPSLFRKLMVHLFPDPKERDFVLAWMHHALFNRCETMLCLNGAKGCGKGLFNKVLRHLVGPNHHEEIKDSAFDQFNAQLENKRIIVADEVTITKRRHTSLKKFANNLVPIEAKGQDTKTSQVYYSWVISNNDPDDLYLESDDRRFSVPYLNDKPLLKLSGNSRQTGMTQSQIDELVREVEKDDSDLLVELGNYILNLDEELLERYNAKYAWISDKFFELCFVSLASWEKFTIDALSGRIDSLEEGLKEEGGINIGVLRRAYEKESHAGSRIPSNIEKIEKLAKRFTYKGEIPIFTVDKDLTGQYFLSPTEDYSSMIGLEFNSNDSSGEDFSDEEISLDDI
jgi:hypothetical protein